MFSEDKLESEKQEIIRFPDFTISFSPNDDPDIYD